LLDDRLRRVGAGRRLAQAMARLERALHSLIDRQPKRRRFGRERERSRKTDDRAHEVASWSRAMKTSSSDVAVGRMPVASSPA